MRTFRHYSAVCLLIALGCAAAPLHWSQRRPAQFDKLRKNFRQPDMIYAPFMFWFWDEPLNPAKMGEMARTMAAQRINPGYAHARRSMVKLPDLPDEEWLGDKWFDSLEAAAKQAEASRSYIAYCDEYRWPDLQANGRVLKAHPELRAESLIWKTLDVQGGAAVELPANFFAVAAQLAEPPARRNATSMHVQRTIRSSTLRMIEAGEAFRWQAPAGGDWRVYAFSKINRDAVNYLDDRLGKAFIEIALEPYARRMGSRLGKTVVADFVDHEGWYGWRLAWSGTLERRYRERYGRDIRLWMPLLLDADAEGVYARARTEWFELVSDLYSNAFTGVVDWNTRRGMYTTAHFWEESMLMQAFAVGDHLKMQRTFTMPGQDALALGVLYPHDFKEPVSVAEFENRRVMTEMLGAGGWRVFTPSNLKKSVNSVIAWGISHLMPHGVFTTRKLQGNPWTPDWYNENPLFPYLHLWMDFARRASFINSHGRAAAEVLLYHPLESIWALTDANLFDPQRKLPHFQWMYPEEAETGRRANAIDRAYAKAIKDLTEARVEFLVGDRYYLRQMQVKSSRLVRGEFAFKTLVLPPLEVLPLDVARKIVDFAKGGGRVYALGALPSGSVDRGMGDAEMTSLMTELRGQPAFSECEREPAGVRARLVTHWRGWEYETDPNPYGLRPLLLRGAPGLESSVRFVSGAFPMLQHHRRIDGREFFWLANNNEEAYTAVIRIPAIAGQAAVWNCETGDIVPVAAAVKNGGTELQVAFEANEAFWLVIDPKAAPSFGAPMTRQPGEPLLRVSGPWTARIDPAVQPVLEAKQEYPAELVRGGVEVGLTPWTEWRALNTRFAGHIDYETRFDLPDEKGRFVLDLGEVHDVAEVWINGRAVGKRLWGPYRFDLSSAARPGHNVLKVRVGNLVNNYYGQQQPSGLIGPVLIRR